MQLTSAELQELLDRWLSAIYSKHEGLHGATPAAIFTESEARGEVRRVVDERLLDLLLGEDGVAVVGAKGLRIKGAQFWDDALIEWRGRKIQFVRTRDAGRIIVYSDDENPKFICLAVDINAEGVDRQIIALTAKQREKEWLGEQLAELRRMKREHRPENALIEVIEHAEARAAAKLSPETNITAMPAQGEGMREAAAALEALETKPSAPEEHADRAEVDAEYEEIARATQHEIYDEALDAEMTVERWQRLSKIPPAKWTDNDRDFFELARELPEIKQLMRRSA
jgi:Mu transposase-like protein